MLLVILRLDLRTTIGSRERVAPVYLPCCLLALSLSAWDYSVNIWQELHRCPRRPRYFVQQVIRPSSKENE
ncbi:hypothetical protein ACLK1T_22550 [Escherichia coli]